MKNKTFENEAITFSIRGGLIKQIIINLYDKSLFKTFNEVKELLLTSLNSHLKFKTEISNLKKDTEFLSGSILFKDEDNIDRSIMFTILSKNEIMIEEIEEEINNVAEK